MKITLLSNKCTNIIDIIQIIKYLKVLLFNMFWITKYPSPGSFIQYLDKNYKNGSVVSVDMDVVGVMAAYSDCN